MLVFNEGAILFRMARVYTPKVCIYFSGSLVARPIQEGDSPCF